MKRITPEEVRQAANRCGIVLERGNSQCCALAAIVKDRFPSATIQYTRDLTWTLSVYEGYDKGYLSWFIDGFDHPDEYLGKKDLPLEHELHGFYDGQKCAKELQVK